MSSVRGFVLFFGVMITNALWSAMDRTIAIKYFGEYHATGSTHLWIELMMIVMLFILGLPRVRKATVSQNSNPTPKLTIALIVSWLAFGVGEICHLQTAIARTNAIQAPQNIRLLFDGVTALGIIVWMLWPLWIYHLNQNQRNLSAS